MQPASGQQAAGASSRRLFVYNGGFWFKPRLKRILALAGWQISTGLPSPGEYVGIWGASPTAWRGRKMAAKRKAHLITVEDAFLRSVLPGRTRHHLARRGAIGLLIDPHGLHFDPTRSSLIEKLVPSARAGELADAAMEGIERLRHADLSKYNAFRPDASPPPPGYVLVIDQTRGDASLMGAGRERFLEMLQTARDENPGARIVLRSHPETSSGLRPGHLAAEDLRPGEEFCDAPVSPWKLVENADAVYAVSSQLGYEALLSGHRPKLFGQPFYAGWGLSDDRNPLPPGRRTPATREALFAASHLLAPIWYDPCRDRQTDFNGAVDQLEAETRAFRQDRDGHLAYGMRLWKRRGIARTFNNGKGVRFTDKPNAQVTLAWAGKADRVPQAIRVEDGFLRSRGLGAALVPALSLVADDLGIYYDPTRESRLERMINQGATVTQEKRARTLIDKICAAGLSKYNLSGSATSFPRPQDRKVILVPGQVEDDASIRLGSGLEKSNLDLLKRVRAENPRAFLVYKPHPDVEAGLRPGTIAQSDLSQLADHIAYNGDPVALLGQVDEVWTMTSTLGFEALIREVPVTVLGVPFYAGWGLTRDLGPVPLRRQGRPSLAALAHACLIGYPRYHDPVSGLPCPVEVAVDRLLESQSAQGGPGLRVLAKIQGALAGHSWLWRR